MIYLRSCTLPWPGLWAYQSLALPKWTSCERGMGLITMAYKVYKDLSLSATSARDHPNVPILVVMSQEEYTTNVSSESAGSMAGRYIILGNR